MEKTNLNNNVFSPLFNKKKREEKEETREVILSIHDLHKSYGKKEVLKGINLDVYKGEVFGFIGKNGAGKSTTIASLA